MASTNKVEAMAAQETFASLLAPVLSTIYQAADTTAGIYQDIAYRQDEDPSLPLEVYGNKPQGYMNIWSQSIKGGLATNQIHDVIEEVKFHTYTLDSAVSYNVKFARRARLNVIAKALERMVQEVLLKTNVYGWSTIFGAIANSSYTVKKVASQGTTYRSATANQFSLTDFNKLITFFRRLNASWNGGTPVGGASKPTNMILSPEMMESLRTMAYNPINTTAANGVAISANSQQSAAAVVALPEADRKALYASAGIPNFYGVDIAELLELGLGMDYQTLFSQYSTASIAKFDGTGGAVFDKDNDELIVVLDASKDFAFRAIKTDGDNNSVFALEPDDQFVKRSGKIGLYGGVEEGRMVLDARGAAALLV
jgi:hypothetical protein